MNTALKWSMSSVSCSFLDMILFLTSHNAKGSSERKLPLHEGDVSITAALVRQGIIPCAPYYPTVAFTCRLLELYRNTSLQCPHLAIQPFIKAICDIQSTPFRPYLSNQFSIAFDYYLSICENVDLRVQTAIGRSSTMWQLRHACPACTYRLEEEPDLIFQMLVTMDGNDSLKRILRRKPDTGLSTEAEAVQPSNEREDSRTVGGDYYISRERVDRWSKEILARWLAIPGNKKVCHLIEGKLKLIISNFRRKMVMIKLSVKTAGRIWSMN